MATVYDKIHSRRLLYARLIQTTVMLTRFACLTLFESDETIFVKNRQSYIQNIAEY